MEINSVEVDGDSACVVVDDTIIECISKPIDHDNVDDLSDDVHRRHDLLHEDAH